MSIAKRYKCVGCTMVCQQTNNEKECKDKAYKYYDSADGFESKEEAWKHYNNLIKNYYKQRKTLKKKTKVFVHGGVDKSGV